MEFTDYAASETSALIDQLFAERSEQSLQELQVFRQALDTAAKAVETAFGTCTHVDRKAGLSRLVERLTAAATAQAEASTQRAFAEAQATIDTVRAELEEQATERQRLAASLDEARAQAEALQSEVLAQRDQARAARAEWEQAQAARTQAEAAIKDAETAKEQEARAKAAVEVQFQNIREELDATRGELSATRGELDATRDELDATRNESGRLSKALEEEAAKRARIAETARLAETMETARSEQSLDGLLAVFQKLATSVTTADVLTALANGLAADFSRVALFKASGNRLEGTHHLGLAFSNDISTMAISTATDSLFAEAMSSDRVLIRPAGEVAESTRALFGGEPASIVVLPVTIHGETLAVIYADDAGRTGKDSVTKEQRVTLADLLRWHAALRLEKLTAEQKTPELRAYATLLVDELEYGYIADTSAGKKDAELRTRLTDGLECARRVYAQRTVLEGPAAASLLEERLTAVIEFKAATPFGRDLAAAAGRTDAAAPEAPPAEIVVAKEPKLPPRQVPMPARVERLRQRQQPPTRFRSEGWARG